MPILHAEIQVGGRQVPFVAGSFSFWQITDYEGRPSTDVRLGLIELTLVGEAATWGFWEEWMLDPHRRQSGRLIFFQNEDQKAKTVIFYDAFCVHYTCRFDARGQYGQGSFEVELNLSAAAKEVQGQFSEAHSVIPWDADQDTRYRALTKPTEYLPSAALAAKATTELAPTDWVEKNQWSNKPRSGEGYKGGRKLSRKELQRFQRHLLSTYGVQMEIVRKGSEIEKKMNEAGGQAGFMASTRKIYVRKGATHYEVSHEMYHAEQWHQLGSEAYNQQTRLEKETYVYNQLMAKEQGNITAEQRQDATDYINRLRKKQGLSEIIS
ncbi:type VI secretion system tube protein TssD [Hymenobacter norwichensis]|uniref:type VI secretion system tube protein TssD n=1 Tax=Hymenobacter norwichensis TaxID=223903 RepID=UPI0003B434E3|nr:type VI secretion system tube protein TssD [Hymenobacter norwichensis]